VRHQLLQRPAGLPEIFLQALYPSLGLASPDREKSLPIADCRLPIYLIPRFRHSMIRLARPKIGNWQSAIGNVITI
jgi:hypothetical protein